MRILHYSLGFPPQRRGGLVNYCLDLAREQVRGGNQVALLYPGTASLWSKETWIKSKAKTRQTLAGVAAYEIINPLPLSIMGGFRNPASFMKPVADPGIYGEFLAEVNPSVIHLHTLYGLHQEFLAAAHRQGIPLVYTTHDYYGLCANPTFFYQNEDYSQKNSVDLWYAISAEGMAPWQLHLLQSPIYPAVRLLSKKLRISRTGAYKPVAQKKATGQPPETTQLTQLQQLMDYYQAMFQKMDVFHFNSSVAEKVYRKNIQGSIYGWRIPITNQRASGQKPVNKAPASTKRVAYAGPYEAYKGYEVFLQWVAENCDVPGISFHLWGDSKVVQTPAYITNHGRFRTATELYEKTDVLIIPSLWQETFGFHVIEALASGTPVFTSHNVGAKDLLPEEYVFEKLQDLDIRRVEQASQVPVTKLVDSQTHEKEIAALYQEARRRRRP